MKTKLRLLVLEDEPHDAEIEIATLENAGIRCEWERVDTQEAFLSRFEAGNYDLILSDYALPGFNGVEALRLVRERDADIPFILVSGTLGEDAAIDSLRSGATDYVLKTRLSRLVPVVERALKEHAEQRARRQAQRELDKSEGRMLTLFNTVPDLIFMKDLDGIYLGCNRAFERLCGRTKEELIGKNEFDIMDRKQAELFRESDRLALENDGPWKTDQKLTFAENGYVGYFEVIKSPLRDTNGEVFGIMGVARDITRRKQATEALQETKQQLQYILDSVEDVIFSMDMNGNYTFSSGAVEKITGYRPEEICRMNLRELVAPEYHDVLLDRLREAEDGTRTGGTHTFEVVCKDGSRRWQEALTRVRYDAATEAPVAIQGVARDITDRRKAEGELQRMAAVINQIVESVVITDPNGRIQYVNPSFEQMTGYRREEVLGQNPSMWKSGRHDEDFYRELWDSLLHDGCWSGRFCNKKKNGAIFTEDATISALRDASGSVVSYVAVKRDITKEIELEEMVRQSQKMDAVGRLAGGMAHDLNNILQTIFGFSSILLMEAKGQEALCANVHEIQQAAKRAGNLTQQLLTFSRKQPTMLVPVGLNEIIAAEFKMLERLLDKDVKLAFEPDRELQLVNADRSQIEQVVMNLVVNARDAMPTGGTISIRTRKVVFPGGSSGQEPAYPHSGQFACISVSDTGTGMDEEIRSHLFEPFFTTKPVGKGTGLGLAVIYGIVEQHNGWIDVESAKGKGSEFKVFLPVCDAGCCSVN